MDDDAAFERWTKKHTHHAELEGWTAREQLLQLELHLCGWCMRSCRLRRRRTSPHLAVKAMSSTLQPVRSEALLSAKLNKRKQRLGESVDAYCQDDCSEA